MEDVILYRYFNNEATPEEVRRIEEWLKADPGHQQEFDAVHMLFNAAVLQEVHRKVSDNRKMVSAWTARRIGRIAVRVAALVVLIVGAGYIGGALMRDKIYGSMTDKTNVLEVPAGHRMSVRLEDGTSVCLNGGARIEYPLLFAEDERRVKLSGEAFFEVAHNTEHPFVVETFASEIEVLGTKFNVFADDENGRFATTLAEGKVRVTNLAGDRKEQVVLNPDEMVRLTEGHLMTFKVSAQDALSWTEGYINLCNVAFDELMKRFEYAYGVKIVIARSTLPRIGYVSGKIRISEGVDFALRLLQQACDFTYSKDMDCNIITIR